MTKIKMKGIGGGLPCLLQVDLILSIRQFKLLEKNQSSF